MTRSNEESCEADEEQIIDWQSLSQTAYKKQININTIEVLTHLR